MALIEFRKVVKSYGNKAALRSLDADVRAGTFTVFCGPPQCGKSVLLRMLIGLEQPDSGRIYVDGTDITDVPPARRTFGYVPQSFALFPHMTVRSNIAYPLRLQGATQQQIAEKLDWAASMLGIAPLLDKTPDQLSGGEKQRTAVARGLMKNAELFILDDPLVGLDFKLRERLMEDLREMQATLGATFLYATSDSLEALAMAEEIVVMDDGIVVEAAGVDPIYREPQRLRSIELIGFPRANTLAGSLANGRVTTPLFDFTIAAETQEPGDPGDVLVAVRPEDIVHDGTGRGAGNGHLGGTATVRLVEDLGGEYVVYMDVEDVTLCTAFPVAALGRQPAYGDTFPFAVAPDALIVFDRATGARVGRGRGRDHA